ncbi:hypothetical protein PSYJA_44546, partial [Pseudomonas syringae pv. japonica str. M301072]
EILLSVHAFLPPHPGAVAAPSRYQKGEYTVA